ncbi:MAG: glycosyl transferase [Rhodospirillaceae bacterium]|nr:glycosyl transferase [Rhodospirillaceae bacterium]
MITVLLMWPIGEFMVFDSMYDNGAIIVALAIISAIFFIEDYKGMPITLRLGAQIIITLLTLLAMGAGSDGGFLVFQGFLPPVLDLFVSWMVWVWFINLFNFMDGIDGISAAQSITVTIGIVVVTTVSGLAQETMLPAILVAGAMAGFAYWNLPPAKVFLGDVGSIPLGFIIGWTLLNLAADGLWVAALILPLYYLVDATTTLIKRILRGERFWHAHRDHFYQMAVINGRSHGLVSLMVFIIGLMLISLALLSLEHPWLALLVASLEIIIFLIFLSGKFGKNPSFSK